MQIIYLDNMYEAEEKILRAHGISTMRIDSTNPPDTEIDGEVIFRGPKMNSAQYEHFLKKSGLVNPLVTPEQYKIAANAIEYSRCFGEFSPMAISFSINDSVEEIAANLKDIKLPLFVRSDIESAVKYVGLEACIMRSIDDLDMVLKPIHTYIKTAETIIMKEVIPIKLIRGRPIEYRAIVIKDQLICFDYDLKSELPDPMKLKWKQILETASKNGMHGAYFLDLGLDTSDRLFVVECKNLLNGTIKNVERFSEGIKTLC